MSDTATSERMSDNTTLAVSPGDLNPCTLGRPRSYLLVASVGKRLNVGLSVRSAAAFGCSEVLACGSISTFGSQGTDSAIDIRQFDKLKHAATWCKERGIAICGIEIVDGALPVHSRPWSGPTAFLAGAEGNGIPLAHRQFCDSFVYVPQFSSATASLNVTVATSIVLHEFALWAGYQEAPRKGEKFVVYNPPPAPRMTQLALDVRTARERDHEAAASSDAATGLGELAGLYSEDADGGGGCTGSSVADDTLR